MFSDAGMEAGFCFEALAADNETMVVVNVCGNSSVGRALAKNMEEVPESHLDEYGLDNLIVPIAVGPAEKCDREKYSFSIDVVIHPLLTSRCVPSHRLFDHYILRLTSLAIEWILQECGIRLNPRSCKLITDKKYFQNGKENFNQILSKIAKAMEKETTTVPANESKGEGFSLPSKLQLDVSRKNDEITPSPLIKEMPQGTGIRKGFLNDVRLYGDGGSSECKQPPLDPLLHLPEQLRKRCQVIDTRQIRSGVTDASAATEPDSIKEKPKLLPSNVTKGAPTQWEVQSLVCNEREIVVRLRPPPSVTSMKDVELIALSDTIEIDETVVRLPRTIKVENVTAKFLKSSKIMVLTCPLA
ncbi:hypothetical protein TraAM80_02331 [Trypanosoma rangeli]|uniref:PIH1 N-terminal domain-containing protein n=1 Tax=Trypanosoma rangeli TaxID=5698 RepID=A0A422NUP7_TRYRA|nr:uncharacterized protein TraAM80_02331 [Trypanosoma rangeli]RNF09186.1 hypothetical protein TraAM80_02331 [Trypanosoma rangeli]|eukprot:RNF09186.1 hypothetical protein TraAM80_02331 [Trypanosoma rangeli]